MLRIISVFLALLLLAGTAGALEVPYLAGRVNDNANMLSAQTIAELEEMLAAHEDSTGNQIVLLTIPTLEGASLEEFAFRVAETWNLGQKDVDNGALLLIVRSDRKLRIEVGYGLEASLTDAITSHIINSVITPRFKRGEFEDGIREGLRTMVLAADGNLGEAAVAEGDSFSIWLFLLFWFSIVGLFTGVGILTKGCMGWGLYAFLFPFYIAPAAILSQEADSGLGVVVLLLYIVGYPVLHLRRVDHALLEQLPYSSVRALKPKSPEPSFTF
jgi:uncharacterized protein